MQPVMIFLRVVAVMVSLCLVVSPARGQDINQQKQQKLNQINEIDAKLKANPTTEEYNLLIQQREKLVGEIKELEQKLLSDVEAVKKINAVKKAFNDGNNAFKLGQNQQALGFYQMAISLDSTFSKAHYGKGLTLKRMRQYPEAIAAYSAAIRHDPMYSDAFVELGKIYSEIDKPDKAIQTFQKALEKDPSAKKAYYELGRVFLLSKKDYNKAADNFSKATQLDPEYDLAFYSHGLTLTELGRLDEAILAFENALAVSKKVKWHEPHYGLAVVYNKKGDFDLAKKSAVAALTINPKYFHAAFEAGRACKGLGQHAEAINYFQKAGQDRAWKQAADYEIDLIRNQDKYGGGN